MEKYIELFSILVYQIKLKKYYDYNGNQYTLFPYKRHKIVIYPHFLKLLQDF